MNKILLDNKKYYYLFSSLIFLTIMFVITEVGVNLNLYSFLTPYKITLLIGALLFLIVFIKNPKNTFSYSVDSLKNQLRECKFLIFFIILYLIVDLVNVLRANNKSIAITKYVTIVSMMAIVFLYLLYLNKSTKEDKVNVLLMFIGAPSIVVAVYTWIYMIIFKTTYYARRLSLIQDYNKYSVVLLFSFIALIYLIFRTVKSLGKRNILLFLTTTFCSSSIHLTASRRSSKMMNVILIVLVLYTLLDTYLKVSSNNKNKSLKKVSLPLETLKVIFFVIITYIATIFIITSYNYLTTERITEATQSATGLGIAVNKGAEEVLSDDKSLDKRGKIWEIAVNSYKNYPTVNKIIGKGGSAQVEIFNEPENKKIMDKEYWKDLPENTLDPHNFLFVDLLNGGILQAGITILCMLSILFLLFKLVKKSLVDAFFIFLLSIMTLGDIAISSRFGMFDNKFIWMILIILITVFNSIRNKDKNQTTTE